MFSFHLHFDSIWLRLLQIPVKGIRTFAFEVTAHLSPRQIRQVVLNLQKFESSSDDKEMDVELTDTFEVDRIELIVNRYEKLYFHGRQKIARMSEGESVRLIEGHHEINKNDPIEIEDLDY